MAEHEKQVVMVPEPLKDGGEEGYYEEGYYEEGDEEACKDLEDEIIGGTVQVTYWNLLQGKQVTGT